MKTNTYFRHLGFKPLFDAWCEEREFHRMPVIALQAEICRDDLLFEIEVDAVVSTARHRAEPSFDI